ncbi:MAG: hypothetical protein IIZ13_00555 [Renibacterium sp.]|nr:hypothetical protein [Renibacterium sp.]
MRRLTRTAAVVPVLALGLTGAVLLGGCVPPTACTAIGWSNNLVLSVGPELEPVGGVRICLDAECISSTDRMPLESSPSSPALPSPASSSPAPTARPATDPPPSSTDLSGASFYSRDGQNWTFAFPMRSPRALTVQVLGADGAVRRSVAVSPDWIRVGGDDRCGGPAEAKATV